MKSLLLSLVLLLISGFSLPAQQLSGPDSLLIQKVKYGSPEEVRQAVEQGARLFLRDDTGLNLLQIAILRKDPAIFLELQQLGADPGQHSDPPLYALALASESLKMLQLLEQAGIQIPAEAKVGPRYLLDYCAWKGNLELYRHFISKGFSPLHPISGVNTAFSVACSAGDLAMVKETCLAGCDPEPKSLTGPLLPTVVYLGHHEVARWLLDQGADPNLSAEMGKTPLIAAAVQGDAPMIRLLLERGAEIHLPDRDGQTALHKAAANGHFEACLALLEAGAHPGALDSKARSALDLAIESFSGQIAALLLQKGLNPPEEKYQPLWTALMTGEQAPLKKALKSNPQLGLERYAQYPLLSWAIRSGQSEMVHLLLSPELDIRSQALGQCPPMLAACLAQDVKMMEYLLQKGADLNAQSLQSEGAIHAAIRLQRTDLLQWLLERDAVLDRIGPYRRTALCMAIQLDNETMVKMLLEAGADPLLPKGQACAYSFATQHTSPKYLEMLLQNTREPLPLAQKEVLRKQLMLRGKYEFLPYLY